MGYVIPIQDVEGGERKRAAGAEEVRL